MSSSPDSRVIRAATAADWDAIWPVFRDTVAAGETYAYPEDLTSEQARDLWITPPPGATVVLEDDGLLLGTAKMGPNRPGRGDHVGTASFMVAESARGRGVGRALAEHVVAWHREQGFRGHPVQRGGRDQHRRGAAVAVARLRDRRHGARRLPLRRPTGTSASTSCTST